MVQLHNGAALCNALRVLLRVLVWTALHDQLSGKTKECAMPLLMSKESGGCTSIFIYI